MRPTAGSAGVPELAAAFSAWARTPALSAALGAPDSVHLVIDPEAGRVLTASPAGQPLAESLAGAGLASLIRQIVPAIPPGAGPRLARLRLDPRHVAPPVLCWLARHAQEAGRSAILVARTTPVPLPRTRPAPHRPAPPPVQDVPAAPASALQRDDRFVWRMDGAGTLTALTGPAILASLVGQRWQDLAASGRVTGAEGMLDALAERRTFRGEPATLATDCGPVRVELSGAPVGRSAAAFAGFGGFGLIRFVPEPARPPAHADGTDAAPEDLVPAPAAPVPADPDMAAGPLPEPLPELRADAAVDGRVEQPAGAPAAGPAPVPAALSTDEHAAFREIARALGARYAGDETEVDPGLSKPAGGAVMPFPGTAPSAPEPRVAAGAPAPETEILGGLPLPALIHRGDAILAANGRLLALTGHADLAGLATTAPGALLPGLGPEADSSPRRTALMTVQGRARPVEALSGACVWAGAPATCTLVRPLADVDAAGALAAERLARAAQAERTASAEAALDALPSGVVTVDGAGRVLTINRAAAALLGGDAREVVGGSLATLFDRDSVLAVVELLRGGSDGARAVLLGGETVTLAVTPSREDGRRVAILARDRAEPPAEIRAEPGTETGAEPHAPPLPPGAGRSAAFMRLDRAFREPLTGLLDLTDAMLKEPFGPLGDARYRGCLAEIRAAGEAMLDRVGTLIDLAAVEAGALRLEPRPLDLNDVAAGCVARLQGEAARGRIVVRTSFSSELADLEADEPSVSRAASLVIEHAIRRSSAGGQIIVSTGAAERAAVALRVRDSGAGAARAADAEGEVEEVLALPRALVEANGGRLQLSTRPEDGTLVEIIMPTQRTANG